MANATPTAERVTVHGLARLAVSASILATGPPSEAGLLSFHTGPKNSATPSPPGTQTRGPLLLSHSKELRPMNPAKVQPPAGGAPCRRPHHRPQRTWPHQARTWWAVVARVIRQASALLWTGLCYLGRVLVMVLAIALVAGTGVIAVMRLSSNVVAKNQGDWFTIVRWAVAVLLVVVGKAAAAEAARRAPTAPHNEGPPS